MKDEFGPDRPSPGGVRPGDDVCQLIRDGRLREARERLDSLLLDGLASGPAEPVTDEDWEQIELEALARLARPQSQ